jgi:TM2 domain-containing membrane protein YozV
LYPGGVIIFSDNAVIVVIIAGLISLIFSIACLLDKLNQKMDELIFILDQINDKIKDPDDDMDEF